MHQTPAYRCSLLRLPEPLSRVLPAPAADQLGAGLRPVFTFYSRLPHLLFWLTLR
jgi:hypothetical protein